MEKTSTGKELARYLAVWDAFNDQRNGIKWMQDKKEEYEQKIDVIQEESCDPNAFNICQAIREAQQTVISGRLSLKWCEINSFYAGNLDSKEYALFEVYMGILKKVVNNLVDELEKEPLQITLKELNDSIATGKSAFDTLHDERAVAVAGAGAEETCKPCA